MNRPARADEELDVVLDGHRHLFASELGPAVEAARMLGAELRSIQIAPEVAEQHIAMALARARRAAVRARWRAVQRTAVALVAAAALIVAPAAMFAGAALPGEPLYPLKRSIEAADLAFAFSPASEARAHTRIAAARLFELHRLIRKGRSEVTISGYRDHVERIFAEWLDTSLHELAMDPARMAKKHDDVTRENGPYMANGSMRTLRADRKSVV